MELNYKEFGQGDPIIILHGLFGTLDNWQTIAKRLADHHTVYIVDQRNHGRSPHMDEHNYHVMAEDLRAFMESNWIFNAHVIGHSMGGKVAMQFALDHPDMVNKLVAVDISPKGYPGSHHDIFEALLSLDLDKISDRREADELLAQRIEDEGIRLFLMKNLSREKGGGYAFKVNLPVLYKHYDDILAPVKSDEKFEGPTLFVRGGRSKHMVDGDEVLIHHYFPKAVVKTIEKASHWVHAETPEALVKMISEFLG